ncbi:MAG: hypothetical protein V3V59_05690 [Thermodesulfovibrionales bacterium]
MHDLGICPITRETRLDGEHGCSYAGRACWVVTGSLCGGELQGTFAEKYKNCDQFDFYQSVLDEEYPEFKLLGVLPGKLRRSLVGADH